MAAALAIQCGSCGWLWSFKDQAPQMPFVCKICLEGTPLWDRVIECPPSSVRLKVAPEREPEDE